MGTSTDKLFRGRNRELADGLIRVIFELQAYWPLTVRQCYYQCVSRLLVPNNQNDYRNVSRILTTLRRDGALDWDTIVDRTRTTTAKPGLSDVDGYINAHINRFLHPAGYVRDLVQAQDCYVEVATEKDALSGVLKDAVLPYCTRLNVTRGHPSATLIREIAERFEDHCSYSETGYRRHAVLLYLGDLDPSGVRIPQVLQHSLLEYHGVDVELIRVALNPDQVDQYGLPQSLDAAKETDPNYGAWIEEYGDQAPVELDALHPMKLAEIVQSALARVYDLGEMSKQRCQEIIDRRRLRRMRRKVVGFLREEFPRYFDDSE